MFLCAPKKALAHHISITSATGWDAVVIALFPRKLAARHVAKKIVRGDPPKGPGTHSFSLPDGSTWEILGPAGNVREL